MRDWLGLILALLGLGLTLVGLEPERFTGMHDILFDGGIGLIVVGLLLFAWRALRRLIGMRKRKIEQERAPVPLGMVYDVARTSGAVGEPDASTTFAAIIMSLVRSNAILLLGLGKGPGLEPVPPAHLADYVIWGTPDFDGFGYKFRTIKPELTPENINDPQAFLKLHVLPNARDTIIDALARRVRPKKP